MKTPVDPQLTAEAARFALRFACDDCAHFAPERESSRACGHGWPIRLRRSALERGAEPSDPGADSPEAIGFCKEFELS
jgi:hypothetical protein